MKWFKAIGSRYGHYSIEAVEVEKETAHFVTMQGNRVAKRSSYDNYFPSFGEAKDYLMEKATGRLESAKDALKCAQEGVNQVFEMVEPL